MYAILRTRIEYGPYNLDLNYSDILPEVFNRIEDAVAYIDVQAIKDLERRPEYVVSTEQEFIQESTDNLSEDKPSAKIGEWIYTAVYKTSDATTRDLYRQLEYKVFPVVKRRHSHDA